MTEPDDVYVRRHRVTTHADDVRPYADVEEDRESIYRLREVHIRALENFFGEIDDEERFHALSVEELEMRRERIQRHFADMENAHVLFKQVCMLASDEIYGTMEREFMRTMAKISFRMKELIGAVPNHVEQTFRDGQIGPNSTTMNQSMISQYPNFPSVIRVETARQPEIGTFNGNPADWPAFRDLFIAEVHKREYDPVTKLLYLQKACVEKAADTLGPWQPTADNYLLAWEAMMNSYNDEYHVIHGIIAKMHAVEKCGREGYGSLRKILDALNSATRQLETISETSCLYDQMWIHLAKQRLPGATLDSWEQQRNRHGTDRLPTLEEFKRFLDTKAKGRDCDSGAQANLLAETTLMELGMERTPMKANIIVIDETSINTRGQVVLELWHRYENRQIATGKFIIVDNFYLYHPSHHFHI